MELITTYIKRFAADLGEDSRLTYWKEQLKNKYGLEVKIGESVHDAGWILREISFILRPIPDELVRACGLDTITLRYLGTNQERYPNHGYFCGKDVTLNSDIFVNPDQPNDFFNENNYFITRPQQTLIHEIGHALDANFGHISEQEPWMKLSGWSKEYKPGFKQLKIKEKGTPEVIGEMYYSPSALFTRAYASRNSWDDFADSFSFFVAGMPDRVPATKRVYLDNLLKKYY